MPNVPAVIIIIEYFCLFTLSTIYPKYIKQIAELTLIPVPDNITPMPIIQRLNPVDINNEPKPAMPKKNVKLNFLPSLSEINEASINPIKDPKYVKLFITSS